VYRPQTRARHTGRPYISGLADGQAAPDVITMGLLQKFMERHSWLFFVLMFMLLSCHSSKVHSPVSGSTATVTPDRPSIVSRTKKAKVAYPNWFWQTPTDLPFPTAVGYSSIAPFHSDKALENAIEDGIETLAKSIRVRIHGERLSKNGLQTQRFQEETDIRVKEHVQTTHEILATYRGERLTMVLLGLGEASNLSNIVADVNPSAPDWLVEFPRQQGYIYARGQSVMNHRSKNAWSRAEYEARVNLVLNYESRVSHLVKSIDEHFETFTRSYTDVTLNEIETVARWFDSNERICYVLVRAPITKNADTIRQQLRQLIKPSDTPDKESKEETIRRAFDELEKEIEKAPQRK